MVVLGEEVGGAEEGQRAAPPHRVVLLDVLVGEQVHALMASRRDPARYFVIPGDVEIAVVRARDDHREAVASIRAELEFYATLMRHFLGAGAGEVGTVLELGRLGQELDGKILDRLEENRDTLMEWGWSWRLGESPKDSRFDRPCSCSSCTCLRLT